MSPRYLQLDEFLQMMDEPYRSALRKLLARDGGAISVARGSTHNHQSWAGGYVDHLKEVLNVALVLYDTLSRIREFPFTLSDALVVLFVHDLEKPWSYVQGVEGWRRSEELSTKEAAHAFKIRKLSECGLELAAELERAVRYTEGEVDRYSNRERGMSPLAAFTHMCDVASARLWHDHPLEADDPWPGAARSHAAAFEEDL